MMRLKPEAASWTSPADAVQALIERKQIEQQLKLQAQRQSLMYHIVRRIRASLNVQETLDTAVGELQRSMSSDRVLVYQFLPDGSGLCVAEAVVSSFKALRGLHLGAEHIPEHYRQLYAQGRISITPSVDAALLSECHILFLRTLSVQAKLIVPILQQDHLWGLLIFHQCTGSRIWLEEEVEFAQVIADQLAVALRQAELYEQGCERQRYLESQVAEHTQQLRQQNEELHEASLLKDAFISTVSHELRTPLASIDLAVRMLKVTLEPLLSDQLATSSKIRAYLDILEQQCHQEIELVNDLLDIQRLESEMQILEQEPVDLQQLILSRAELWRPGLEQKSLELTLHFEPPLLLIQGDRMSLTRILSELLNNAYKYTPANGWIRIQVIQERLATRVQFINVVLELEPMR
ncbi:GAF domain-containing sensor histidine kinase [Leptolyngbya sp. FACHB-261]|uniref:GAF domain-containing sensor histidine kinase n=1 Tax=Leptolyngbya sp. FACHB-261 TaxID=2692806 RepID=UPI001682DF50|nr:GAF domain-containing sensor histidine kinase [Leptolyngbya sp. FACHB-261]MBD2102707.1 GAF domain-containing sensor histidine kinase [Leptolyngbya sp. FACHB-261]